MSSLSKRVKNGPETTGNCNVLNFKSMMESRGEFKKKYVELKVHLQGEQRCAASGKAQGRHGEPLNMSLKQSSLMLPIEFFS